MKMLWIPLLLLLLSRTAWATNQGFLTTTKQMACFDSSRHDVHKVRVSAGVYLEVLDWGGNKTGGTMVFLAGLGNTAHIYDEFSYHFTPFYRVLGITRRGYGVSSKPKTGYTVPQRAKDDIAVLDHFKIKTAIFVGHSVSGVELSRLAADFPNRVSKLIYLDAYEYGPSFWNLPQDSPPSPPPPKTPSTPLFMVAHNVALQGFRGLTQETCQQFVINDKGETGNMTTPMWINEIMMTSSGTSVFEKVKCSVLGILASPPATPPYVYHLDEAQQKKYHHVIAAQTVWQREVMDRMKTLIQGKVDIIVMEGQYHYVFLSGEAQVVNKMYKWLGIV